MHLRTATAAGLLWATLGVLQGCGGSSSAGSDEEVPVPPPTDVAPAALLDLGGWALTIPRDAGGGTGGSAEVVSAARLVDGYASEWFQSVEGDGVMFFAPVDGAVTANARYPVSMLRELLDPSDASVNWNWNDFARMDAVLAVHRVPRENGKVVVAQIRGYNGEDVAISELCKLVFEYDGPGRGTLYVLVLDSPVAADSTARRLTLGGGLGLGETFTISLRVQDRTLHVAFGAGSVSTPIDAAWDGMGLYFRAGAAPQAAGDSGTDGARVTFYQLDVTHQI
jgi:hypothetical protein